ncbi:MAG: hypothetical protein GXP50_04120 [Deltaproteobacteria bacterium]|nr:hypothetical protein [Deltaproteobacteria bacterium]
MRLRNLTVAALVCAGLVWGATPGWGACTSETIGPNDSASGSVDTQDCPDPDGTYYDLYYVTLPSDGVLTVDMTSSEFDTYLLLYDEAQNWLAEDDDSGGGGVGDAQIAMSLAAGTYVIVANNSEVGQTGAYVLVTRFTTGSGGEDDGTEGSGSGGNGGSGDGGSEGSVDGTTGDVADVSGSWTVHETVDGSDCGEGTTSDSYTIAVTQNGTQLAVTAQGNTFAGTVSGNTLSWTGSYPEEGGTTTITSLHLTLDAAGTSGGGTVSWTWTDGTETCSGTTEITVNRAAAGESGGSTGDATTGSTGGGGGGCFLQQVGEGR